MDDDGAASSDSERLGPNDLTIMTLNGTVAEPDSWLAFTYAALSESGGFITVRSGPPNLYAQAINHDGQLLLENRDGSPSRHYQAQDVSRADIAEALSQWTHDDRDFIGHHEWRLVEL